MKKNFVYALMSAIALTGAVSFSSCSSSDDSAEANPNFNPQTNEVLTQFLFNVSTGNTASTRQTAAATQATTSTTFRGIDDSHIMCFKTGTANNGNWIASGETTVDRDYPMESVVAAASLSSAKSARVLEMSLPLKTNTMMFYGRATKNTDKNACGYLSNDDGTSGYNISADMTGKKLNTISFHLGRRLTSDNKTKFEQTQKLLAAVLTCVMNVRRGSADVDADDYPSGLTVNPYKFALTGHSELTWASYVYGGTSPISGNALAPLEEKMARAHYEMTKIKTNELRNASGPAILAMIEDLWTIVNAVRYADPVNEAEATAKYMAELVNLELKRYFDASVPNDGGVVTINYIKSASAVVSTLTSTDETNWPETGSAKPQSTDFSQISNITETAYLDNFPANFDLPQGATHILYDTTTKVFSYAVNFTTSAVGSGGNFTVDDYYFPPELLYFGNSPLRVSNQEHVVGEYPQNTTNWDTDGQWPTTGDKTWTTPGEVQSSTRSVAMKYDINYGTALLKTTVAFADGLNEGNPLEDNNAYIQFHDYGAVESNHQIEPTDGLFTLVGVLVGGQYPKVGWDFLPIPFTNPETEHTGYVFDNDIAGDGKVPTPGGAENYTLVFDNYKPGSGTGTQDKVYVALEFRNNGPDFFGADNLITNGSNFYLIGELDPTKEGLAALNWPTHHALPPYASESEMNNVTRVFIQDYMTTAKFKIGKYSLQYAYLTVPDLRASSVTLGLSVDLSWSTGLVFDDLVIGGGANKDPNP